MSSDYVKHLIQCKCILPQFRKMEDPPFHKFIVLSELDERGDVISSFAQCTNCEVIHKVTEVTKSEILKKEHMPSILTIDEIKGNLPEKLVVGLSTYELDLHQWQEIKWILDNEGWGRSVILTKEVTEGVTTGKYIQIIGTTLWKFGSFSRDEMIAKP